jgi:hypothetical protein
MNVTSPAKARWTTSVIGTKMTVHRLIDKVCDLLPVATATPKFDHL